MTSEKKRRRSRSMTTDGSPTITTTFDYAQDRFLKETKNTPMKNMMFFTFKDNSGRYILMDKVRKWAAKWSNHYLIVRSPVGGIHFHGLCVRNGTAIRYLKGIHLNLQCLGSNVERLPIIPEPHHETHPFIPDYKVSANFMSVMSDIRHLFGGPKTSLPTRIKARKARMKSSITRKSHVDNCLDYLRKNFNEGQGIPYDDIVIK